MEDILDLIKNRKNLIGILVLLILVVAIGLGIYLVRQQQIIKSRAAASVITFTSGDGQVQQSNGSWTTTNPQIKLKLTAPNTVTITPSPTVTPTNTPTPTFLDKPTNLSHTCKTVSGATVVEFKWDAVNGAQTYQLRINKKPYWPEWYPADPASGDQVPVATSNSYMANIISGADYMWSVQAKASGLPDSDVGGNTYEFQCP